MAAPSEFAVDAAADYIVDLAMSETAVLNREERDQFRTDMQNAVDALVDACRDYYRELYTTQKETQ